MKPLNFYPGPSRTYDALPQYFAEACARGISSINHRSPEFVDLSRKTIGWLKSKLDIPEEYGVYYVTSATECWEILAQSLIKSSSFHLFDGAFGEKAWKYTQKLKPHSEQIVGHSFQERGLPGPRQLRELLPGPCEMIALTHSETSRGSLLPQAYVQALREEFPEPLIALDATSSLAGAYLDFRQVDAVYASVQKCLGLPAGMGILILSPRAQARANEIGEHAHYNSLNFLMEKMENWQTTYTPNVVMIYMLMRVLEAMPSIHETDALLRERAHRYYSFFADYPGFGPLVEGETQSYTVICLQGAPERVEKIKQSAREAGLILGNGYGPWKQTSFRIANFPAIPEGEIKTLLEFLRTYAENI